MHKLSDEKITELVELIKAELYPVLRTRFDVEETHKALKRIDKAVELAIVENERNTDKAVRSEE